MEQHATFASNFSDLLNVLNDAHFIVGGHDCNQDCLIGNRPAQIVEIYKAESDRRMKEAALGALFVSGSDQALIEIARTEKDPELKKKAVSHLANMGSKEATAFLLEILNK